MLTIAGHFTVDPARRDEYVDAFADLVRRCREAPGRLDVAVAADTVDAGRVHMYERWESWADVTAWRAVADAPEVDIAVADADVAMWTPSVNGRRSPSDLPPGGPRPRSSKDQVERSGHVTASPSGGSPATRRAGSVGR